MLRRHISSREGMMHEARFHKLQERSLHGIAGSHDPHARPFDSFVVEINPSFISFTQASAMAIRLT